MRKVVPRGPLLIAKMTNNNAMLFSEYHLHYRRTPISMTAEIQEMFLPETRFNNVGRRIPHSAAFMYNHKPDTEIRSSYSASTSSARLAGTIQMAVAGTV
jgi:hypothetical protein